VGCCNASHPLCINCGGQHASFDSSCHIRREVPSALRPPKEQDIPDAPLWAPPQQPPRVRLFTQLYRPIKAGMVLVSLPLVSLSNPNPLNWFVARLPNLTLPLPSPAGISLVLAAPSAEQAPVPTGASTRRLTSTWSFRCRQTQPQHRVLHHPNHSIILVV